MYLWLSQSRRYFLMWNRAFLKRMEMLLQKTDCDVTIPYYDFTTDAGWRALRTGLKKARAAPPWSRHVICLFRFFRRSDYLATELLRRRRAMRARPSLPRDLCGERKYV